MIGGTLSMPDAIPAAAGRIPPPLLPSAPPSVPEVEPETYEVPDRFKVERTSPSPEAAPREEESRPDRETLRETIEKLNRIAEGMGHRLAFGLYDVTDEFYSKVIDRRTNKIVKLLPPKEILELHRKLQEALGVILDERA